MDTTFNGSKILAKEFEGELWIKASDINLAAKGAPTTPEPVAFPPIERDEEMDRTYIPVHQNWEIQTQGTGSSFRIAKRDDSGERWLVLDKHLHDMLTEMAEDIHKSQSDAAAIIADLKRRIDDLEWENKGIAEWREVAFQKDAIIAARDAEIAMWRQEEEANVKLRAEVERLTRERDALVSAIDNEMVVSHIGIFSLSDDPKVALNKLMCYAQGLGEYFAKEQLRAALVKARKQALYDAADDFESGASASDIRANADAILSGQKEGK